MIFNQFNLKDSLYLKATFNTLLNIKFIYRIEVFWFSLNCLKDLLKCFDEIIIKETVNSALLSKNENRIYEFCNNPMNWETMTRKQRYKYKNQYADIMQLFGQQRFKLTIRELLLNKGNEIINVYKSGYILTDIKKKLTGTF